VGGSAALSAAGGGSGNPVMFSADPASAGVCAVAGSTVSYTAAGSCVIDANQAGNGTYAAAPQVQQMITVSSGQKKPPVHHLQSPGLRDRGRHGTPVGHRQFRPYGRALP
jgi:hypothetical protein